MSVTPIHAENTPPRVAANARLPRVPIALTAICILGMIAAWAIYLPTRNTPFDLIDFSEFLPFLRENESFTSRFSEFASYYASQGRLNPLSYVFIIWKWSLFGWNEAGWQMARFIQMVAIVYGVYVLLRRLGSERWGAVAGAALFVVAQTASPAWIRLTMGEPSGLMAILGAALIATQYQDTPRWRVKGITIALLLTASLLIKEMLVALVPFVLLLACTRRESGEFERFSLSQRNLWIATLVSVGVVGVLAPVAVMALQATDGAYVSDYGRGPLSLHHFVYSLTTIVLPVRAEYEPNIPTLLLPGNLLFAGIVSTGWWLAHRDAIAQRLWRPLGMAAVALAGVGAAIYLPLPYFNDFYGLPFLLAPALLLALAITSIERARHRWRWLAYAGCLVLLGQGAMFAAYNSREAIAQRSINRVLVSDFVQHASADSVVVAMRYLPAQRWQGIGPRLERYARAVVPDEKIPAISDALCDATLPMLRDGVGNAMLVTYSDQCGAFPIPTRSLRYHYTYVYWPTLTIKRDSLMVSILGPSPVK